MSDELLRIVRNVSRLIALQHSGLLDSPAEETFDRFTRLATRTLNTPVALLSLVDADRQFFKSAIGLSEPLARQRGTPLTQSFCKHVVGTGQPLIIQDTRTEPLVQDIEGKEQIGAVAYAGMPILSDNGHVLGSFCVIDDKPRSWTSGELRSLRDLADCVTHEIALRAHVRHVESEREATEERLRALEAARPHPPPVA